MKIYLSIALLAAVSAANAEVLWDTVYTSSAQTALRTGFQFAGNTTGNYFAGQTFKLATAGAFKLDELTFMLRNVNATPLASQNVSVSLYASPNMANFNTAATVFDSAPVYTFSGNLGVATLAGAALNQNQNGVARISGIDGIVLDSSKTYGVTISTLGNAGAVPTFSYGSKPYVGDANYVSGGGGWFLDRNMDGVLAGTEYGFFQQYTYNQLAFSLGGTPQAVPEPASLAVLAIGTALLRRRRQKG